MDNQKIKDWIFLTVGVVLIFLAVRFGISFLKASL